MVGVGGRMGWHLCAESVVTGGGDGDFPLHSEGVREDGFCEIIDGGKVEE